MAHENLDRRKQVVDQLFQELAWLHVYWRYYEALFASDSSRIDVMNKRTGEIFWLLQTCLQSAILLQLANLLGAESSLGKEVVSIRRAIVDLFPKNDPRRVDLLEQQKERMLAHRWIFEIRNTTIAHVSLQRVATGSQQNSVSVAALRQAVSDCVALMNQVLRAYSDSEYGFPDEKAEERRVRTLIDLLSAGNDHLDTMKIKKRKEWRDLHGGEGLPPERPYDDELE